MSKKIVDASGATLEKRHVEWSVVGDFEHALDEKVGLIIKQTFVFQEDKDTDRQISWNLDFSDLTWREFLNFGQHAAKTLWIQRWCKENAVDAIALSGTTVKAGMFRPERTRSEKDPVAEIVRLRDKLVASGMTKAQIARLMNESD